MNCCEYRLDDYQEDALKFRKESATVEYCLLNLSGEVGELHSLVAKAIRDGKKEDYKEQFLKECGDVLWQLSAVLADEGFSLSDAATTNINKLSSRKERGAIQGSGDNR